MSNQKKHSVVPTSIDEVPVRGKGGLRKSLLGVTLVPLIIMGLVFLAFGSVIYSKALQKQMQKDMENVATSVLTYYEFVHPGEYSILIDEKKEKTYLKKGSDIISDEPGFIDEIAEETDTQISVFFYDTRLMTTIRDSKGKRINMTIANSKITDAVLKQGQTCFFDAMEIEFVRYCVMYMPIRDSKNTVIGMIGVGQPYSILQGYVNRILLINFGIILFAMLIGVIWMIKYTGELAGALDKLANFMGSMAEGKLDRELDQSVLDRADEIGDMGRYTLYLRGALKKLVEKDPLTNLYNRRSGQNKMDQIRRKAEREFNRYSIAIGDIDFFKRVNDTYGHDAGDAVLKEVARILSNNMMGHGAVVRWGGEEFLFVFDHEGVEASKEHLNSILNQIRATSVEFGDQIIKFTMSYGVVEGNWERKPGEEITAADELLYFAKEHGRNQVVSLEEKINIENRENNAEAVDVYTENETSSEKATELNKMQETKEEISMGKEQERWDIYDRNKQLTGRTMKRNDWTLADDEYHLTVLGVVADTKGRFLITKRVMTKSWAPGWWEVSGGAAMAGETSAEAVKREVLEETGLDVSDADGGYVFTYHRENPGEGDNYFVDIYRFIMDFDEADIHLQEEETAGYMLATPEEIAEFGKEGIFLHYDSIKEVFNL